MPLREKPSRMASAAPKHAPEEAPRMSGAAMGLRNTLWYAVPAVARLQPTMQASRMRGSRMFSTAASICSVQLASMGKMRDRSIRITSEGGTS